MTVIRLTLLIGCLFLPTTRVGLAETASKPNIVLILADDIGLGDIGAHHREQTGEQPLAPTPTLDTLAWEGMWFTDFHSPTALCSPSRYAYMSGNYNYRSSAPWGVWSSFRESPFTEQDATLGTVTKQAGYKTAFIGKWHLGGDFRTKDGDNIYRGAKGGKEPLNVDASEWIGGGPKQWGFDYDFTMPTGVQGPFYVAFENGKWYPLGENSELTHLDEKNAKNASYVSDKGPGPGDSEWDATKVNTLLAEKATDFIRRESPHGPFFLCYWTSAVHIPHLPPEKLDDERIKGTTPSRHLDMVRVLDWEVRQIVGALKETKSYKNTLILFTSDNGGLAVRKSAKAGHDSSGGWRGHKNSTHEGGHRVPLIAVWPEIIEAGRRTDALVNGTDILATIAAISGTQLTAQQGQDSHNFLSLLRNEEGFKPREEIMLQGGSRHELVYRQGPWKLIIQSNHKLSRWEPIALFDLSSNPGENEELNLVAEPEHAERVAEMLNRYREIRDSRIQTVSSKTLSSSSSSSH